MPDGAARLLHAVVPGTATTMVKALADAGLAQYEPYVGVRLTPAGEKLAALVLRRHRLIELFLVKVMDMSWTEVHDEAENLEHAVPIDSSPGWTRCSAGPRSTRTAIRFRAPEGIPADARVRQPAHLPARDP